MKTLLASLLLVICATPAEAQFSFKKVQVRTSYGAAEQGNKGKLIIDSKQIQIGRASCRERV